jgi:hypothetical protein
MADIYSAQFTSSSCRHPWNCKAHRVGSCAAITKRWYALHATARAARSLPPLPACLDGRYVLLGANLHTQKVAVPEVITHVNDSLVSSDRDGAYICDSHGTGAGSAASRATSVAPLIHCDGSSNVKQLLDGDGVWLGATRAAHRREADSKPKRPRIAVLSNAVIVPERPDTADQLRRFNENFANKQCYTEVRHRMMV